MNGDAISLGPSLHRREICLAAPYDRGRSQASGDDDSDTSATEWLEMCGGEGLSGQVCWGKRVLLASLAKTLNVSTVPSLLGHFTPTRQSTMSNTWVKLYLRLRCQCAAAAR
jgi:hypothetical protein